MAYMCVLRAFVFKGINYTPMPFDVPLRALYCVHERVKRISAKMNVYK